MASSFADRLKKLQQENKAVAVDWKAQGAQTCDELGVARQAAPTREIDAANTIDKGLPTVRGRVVDATPGKIPDSMEIVIAITEVDVPSSSPDSHIVKLPSGAVTQVGIAKWQNPVKEMIAAPHIFPDKCFAVELDGNLAISVPTKKNAKVGGVKVDALEFVHVQPGTFVEIARVALEYRVGKESGRAFVIANAGSITVLDPLKKQPFVSTRHAVLFKTLNEECVGYQRQLCRSLARMTGCAHPELVKSARADAKALAARIAHLATTFKDHKVVIDAARSVEIMSDAACESMKEAAIALNAWGDPDRPMGAVAGAEVDFHAVMPFDGSRAHIVPIVQNGMEPSQDKEVIKRGVTGFGVNANGLKSLEDNPDPVHPSNKLKFAAEALLTVAADKLARTDEQKRKQSIGALVFDVACVNLCIRDDDGKWKFCTPSLTGGAAISPMQCSFSAVKEARFDAKNTVGFYDFDKMPMVAHELCKFMPQLFFANDYDQVATASGFGVEASSTQPAVAANWGGTRPGATVHNKWDMCSGIQSVGVRLSEAFVKKVAVHAEDGTVVTKQPHQEYGMLGTDKKTLMPPAPPTLEKNGYVPINAIAETNFAAKIRNAPEGTGAVHFYAIFEGCSAFPDDAPHKHEVANVSDVAGEAVLMHAMDRKYTGIDLNDAIKDHVAIYAVATPKVLKVMKREAAEDSSDEENSGKKSKPLSGSE